VGGDDTGASVTGANVMGLNDGRLDGDDVAAPVVVVIG
jgi:hypothetical protein